MNVYVGGAALPIGRTYKDAFTEAFSRYMAKKGVGRSVPVINWILSQQIQLGMILCACLFVPWGQRRSCFVPRLAAGVCVFLVLTDTLTFLPFWGKICCCIRRCCLL